jgi:hypothetical protein
MTIKVSVEIETPLMREDLGILTAISVMLLAVGDRPLAEQRFPDVYPKDEDQGPQPCGAVEVKTGFRCVSEVGHAGRHRYRDAMGDAMVDSTGDPTAVN